MTEKPEAQGEKRSELAALRLRIEQLEAENRKLRASNRRWMRIAGTDDLTNLPNKMFLTSAVLPQLINKSEAGGETFSCLIVAPDQLSEINEKFGREAGDGAVCALAEFLSGQMGEGERVIHMDGANFVLVLPGADAAEARKRARILRARLATRAFPVKDQTLLLTLSMGAVTYEPGSVQEAGGVKEAVEQLVRRMTATLDVAKRKGRDRLVEESELKS